jgi:hypothetical protein
LYQMASLIRKLFINRSKFSSQCYVDNIFARYMARKSRIISLKVVKITNCFTKSWNINIFACYAVVLLSLLTHCHFVNLSCCPFVILSIYPVTCCHFDNLSIYPVALLSFWHVMHLFSYLCHFDNLSIYPVNLCNFVILSIYPDTCHFVNLSIYHAALLSFCLFLPLPICQLTWSCCCFSWLALETSFN